MTNQSNRARDIFLQAIDIQSSEDRQAFLNQACQADHNLRRRVAALLAAHDDPESYLDRPAARFDVTATFAGNATGPGLSDSSSYHGRFLPGTKIADRFRIVSLLGSGGMGDVYRADDLRLGQPVALKFLPSELAKDQKRLDYFHKEVKLARQVSHPNVCRVYDIGEVDGQFFISMEYIDGEDLKALLHRIGRLPNDKGIQIAQQLCAGLAAAHAQGVLHRDLKPANIMIDGQGQVRITDFGLATVTTDGENVAGMSGTPAYMAPEQLLRGQSSAGSDIYSLGLVLFELFTGKTTHQASSLAELQQLHEDSSAPRDAKDIVEDIDPSVDRIISRCLDPDPVNRPKSVSAIAAALPGGQPLDAAIAAGETPLPELVAASGGTGILSPTVATSYLIGILTLLVLAFIVIPRTSHIQAIGADDWPAPVLRHQAREILRHLGIEEQRNSVDGFANRKRELRTVESQAEESPSSSRTDLIQTGPLHGLTYWYRESPEDFFVNEFWREMWLSWNRANEWSPPWTVPEMNGVHLTPTGQLRWFRAIPAAEIAEAELESPPEWLEWFDESITGIDLSSLQPATWQGRPPDAFDQYQAWEGNWPNSDVPLKVQVASYRGKPVFFEVMSTNTSISGKASKDHVIMGWIYVVVDLVPFLLAWYHYRRGRGDRRGARYFAIYIGCVTFIANLMLATHVQPPFEMGLLLFAGAVGSGAAVIAWVVYMGIEPLARRYWPSLLISWTRLLRGSFTDPRVGRDLLVGVSFGIGFAILERANGWWLGRIPTDPEATMGNVRSLLGFVVAVHTREMLWTFGLVVLLVVFTIVTRTKKIAPFALFALSAFVISQQGVSIAIIAPLASMALQIWILVYCGLLAAIAAATVMHLVVGVITTNLDAFYATNGLILVAIILAIAVYGFVCSQGHAIGRTHRHVR
ncbi:serine/threonine-protein kinase [Bythopirellula polymerisocia]|uniref:Serine/threonine-protein kinase PrkC n=1 Tax=Bythopirellula polymerisocia TaxID=2528003 RepID=A0A5C6D0A0_9BACT|nr:serine/threonine-protein kinase [Bythopirellula polymerisocia]TWU30332.1 Serine/threonine-protein kinase PrkC [Bythopirellula polymerisocia]